MAWKNSNRTKQKLARQNMTVQNPRTDNGRVIIENGKLTYKSAGKGWHGETILDTVLRESGYDRATQIQVKAIAKSILRQNGTLTEKSLISRLSDSKVRKTFINAGLDIEDVARELNTTIDELENPDNWTTTNDGQTIVAIGTEIYKFTFGYNNNVFSQV